MDFFYFTFKQNSGTVWHGFGGTIFHCSTSETGHLLGCIHLYVVSLSLNVLQSCHINDKIREVNPFFVIILLVYKYKVSNTRKWRCRQIYYNKGPVTQDRIQVAVSGDVSQKDICVAPLQTM